MDKWLDMKSDGLRNLRIIGDNLSNLASALSRVGNDNLAVEILSLSHGIYDNSNLVESAINMFFDEVFAASRQASVNVLTAGIKVAGMIDKERQE